MAQAQRAASLELRSAILIAREHDGLATDPQCPELHQGARDIGGKARNRLARLQCAAMRKCMRSDLLSGAGRNQPPKARAEMIRIAPLVRTDILQPRNFGPFAGGKFCPGQELVFALAEKRPDRRPGRPNAAALKKVEHGGDCFSSPQHIRPVALARCMVPDAPHQLVIERDDEIAGHAARRAHAASMHRRVSSGQPKSPRQSVAERGLKPAGPDGSNPATDWIRSRLRTSARSKGSSANCACRLDVRPISWRSGPVEERGLPFVADDVNRSPAHSLRGPRSH